ncbi:MAG: hypothetical protein ABIQ15_13990 [Nocardioides sp.]
MGDEALRRSVDAAILPLLVSLGPWGVEEGHWLPDRDGKPVLWLRTRTEIQRVALEAQVWLPPQVAVLLARVGVPPVEVSRMRLEFTSGEAQDRLFDEQ